MKSDDQITELASLTQRELSDLTVANLAAKLAAIKGQGDQPFTPEMNAYFQARSELLLDASLARVSSGHHD